MQMTHTPRGQGWELRKRLGACQRIHALEQSNDMGCLLTTLLVAVCIFVPLVGHIFLTVMIIGDDLTHTEKLLWLLLVWLCRWLAHCCIYCLASGATACCSRSLGTDILMPTP